MMFSHEALWRALDLMAEMHGLSPSALAIKAGLDPTALNPSKRVSSAGRKRWPSTETLSKLLAVVRMDLGTFAKLVEAAADAPVARDEATER